MLDMRALLDRRADGFSQGERMKTALARALVHDPANIVLDEPTNGLDVLATRALRESLRWLRSAEGGSKCIVFSTHVMQEVAELCDRVVVVAEGRTVAAGTPAELLARTGESDFEEAFVRLAFGCPRRIGEGDAVKALLRCRHVCSARNCSTRCATAGPAHGDGLVGAAGPAVLLAVSALVASLEARAERREVYVAGLADAPTLRNFFERQTYRVREAPADYEAQSARLAARRSGRGGARRLRGRSAEGRVAALEIVSDSANQRSQSSTRASRACSKASHERVVLSSRSAASPRAARADPDRGPRSREPADAGAQFTGMLPFFVMMAVLYGALNAALDTTAGERERGSLEPLLMNPARAGRSSLGKWGAVACVSMLIAVLSCFSFLPGQWVLRSDTLAAMFQYGPREAALFLVVLLPFAAALSALLMAVAIRCRTFKEAQASATIVVLAVSLLPLVNVFDLGGEARWHLWVPALAQNTLMTRVLKGEELGAAQVVIPLFVCVLLTAAGRRVRCARSCARRR